MYKRQANTLSSFTGWTVFFLWHGYNIDYCISEHTKYGERLQMLEADEELERSSLGHRETCCMSFIEYKHRNSIKVYLWSKKWDGVILLNLYKNMWWYNFQNVKPSREWDRFTRRCAYCRKNVARVIEIGDDTSKMYVHFRGVNTDTSKDRQELSST